MADDDQKKTLKFQMMMSPGEAKVLDDWMFKHRMRSRAEAIRRLTQIGMTLDRRTMALLEFVAASAVKKEFSTAMQAIRDVAESLPPEARGRLYGAITTMGDFELGVVTRLFKMLLETWPIRTGIPMDEAAELRLEFEKKIDGLSPSEESSELVRMINIISGKTPLPESEG